MRLLETEMKFIAQCAFKILLQPAVYKLVKVLHDSSLKNI